MDRLFKHHLLIKFLWERFLDLPTTKTSLFTADFSTDRGNSCLLWRCRRTEFIMSYHVISADPVEKIFFSIELSQPNGSTGDRMVWRHESRPKAGEANNIILSWNWCRVWSISERNFGPISSSEQKLQNWIVSVSSLQYLSLSILYIIVLHYLVPYLL